MDYLPVANVVRVNSQHAGRCSAGSGEGDAIPHIARTYGDGSATGRGQRASNRRSEDLVRRADQHVGLPWIAVESCA